ncbi:hypothetical protein N7519_001873 [Penicillium mononematosum]|uniref:uncharacterized protein n=1 Tax=Penicillium mononematosum TaxID=268346 RepID=UPI002547925B|nr:uncharacterized protein N7519_001873 [Penicillium mononematosum]KAJ6186965.1 hypothetical protein N7519_001873 [Penicillium mononematosum]
MPRDGYREPGYYWSSSSLYWAVQSGNEEIVEVLLAHLNKTKIEIPNIKVEPLERALHYAARSGYFSIMKVLLDLDSGTGRPSNYDRILSSALGEEAYWYKERDCSCRKQYVDSGSGKKLVTDHFATVKLLLDLGAHANYTKSFSPDSEHKPILLALFKCSSISNGIVKLLVERGASVDSEEVFHGFIETSNQCTFSNEETAKLFFDHGASLRVWDYIGKTVLNRNNKKALIELLVACSPAPGKVDGWGREPLDALVAKRNSTGRAELLRQLLDLDAHITYPITAGPAPLQSVVSDDTESYGCDPDVAHEPCFSFIYNTVKHLLSYGAYGTTGDSEGQTPLHKTDNKRLMELLLAYGEKVNTVDSYGQTPLHAMTYGASKAMVEPIKLLLKHGADIAAKNADDNTPLHLAVLTSDWEVVKLLIDHGSDRNARNSEGETPMDLLSRRRSSREQFSFNRSKKGDLMAFRVQKLIDVYWRGWEYFWTPPPFYHQY